MKQTLADIATLIDGELIGDNSRVIERIAPIDAADISSLSFIADARYRNHLASTRAGGVIVPLEITEAPIPIIRVASPEQAIVTVLSTFMPSSPPSVEGIHPTVIMGQHVKLGRHISIGPHVVIGDYTVLGDHISIGAGAVIGSRCRIGEGAWLFPRVTLYNRVEIGASVIVHSGAVIGSDGFGYIPGGQGAVKVPQIGNVVIEDHVEIGANTTIDRATLGTTRIGRGSKIDNLVQIGHNVIIGENVTICAQVGIAGSTTIKSGAVIAGQAGLSDHITVGEGVKIGGQAGVTKDVPPHTAVSGYPARPHHEARRIGAYISRLPEMAQRLQDLQRCVGELERQLKKSKA